MISSGQLPLFLILSLILARSVSVLQNESIPSWRESKARLKSHVLSHRVVREKLSPVDRNNTIQLSFYFYCYQVLIGEDVEQSFTSYNFLKIIWTEPELTWDPADYGDYIVTNIPYDDMWHPDVMVANSAEKDFMMVRPLNNHLVVHYNGSVTLHTPAYFKTTCSLDLTLYPFDVQECEISFLPFSEDCTFEILQATQEVISDPFNLKGEWTILSRDVRNTLYGGTYPNVKAKVRMRRNSVFYFVTILAPLVVTTAMTSFVFCIPPGSGERISFLVTIFVSNAVFLNFIADTIPRSFTFSNMPRLAINLFGVVLESFFALLGTIFVMWKYNMEQQEVSHTVGAPTYARKESKTNTDHNHLQNIRTVPKSLIEENSTLNNQTTNGFFGKLRLFHSYLPRRNTTVADSLQNDAKLRLSRQDLRVRRISRLTSKSWDVILFILYHVISAPFYMLLFAFQQD
ncbi:hypothetical protein Btru_021305 [Bulinus truncatus]|nr:hypothetical protein Btru_021305 [Bulinus truncatus]